jgi:hypothetical protein
MPTQPSSLLLDELFSAGDERFLDHLLNFHEPKKLASLADRWKADPRPWARRVMFQYLELVPSNPGHEPVVKRLFKHAEAHRDDEAMAHFAYAFDRLIRRKRRMQHHWDWQTRTSWSEEVLVVPRDVMPHVGKGDRFAQNPKTLEPVAVPPRFKKGLVLFSYKTRHYLRRRAWRYFRRLGHQQRDTYCAAVAGLLRLYADGFLGSGESLLDSRTLMHACFRGSDVLEFTPGHVNVKAGRSLGALSAAPTHPALWKRPQAAPVLLELIAEASSRPVRAWGIELLRRWHFDPPPALDPLKLLPLLDHADEVVQQLGADLLERAVGLEKLGIEEWLRLLQTRNLTALETIARVMRQHVTPERLTLAQAVELTTAAPVPVARLGLEMLKQKPIKSAEDREQLARVADAQCAGIAGEIATWALRIVGADAFYSVDNVIRFFDALLAPTRQAAWTWLTSNGTSRPRAYDDPAFWSRLIETPYDDLRMRLVDTLKRRAGLPGVSSDKLGPALWAPILLGVHRGGRAKLSALKQVADAIARDPKNAGPLLPVVAVAVRSVRFPEARHGLAAVVRAVDARPELADLVRKHFPELELGEQVCR